MKNPVKFLVFPTLVCLPFFVEFISGNVLGVTGILPEAGKIVEEETPFYEQQKFRGDPEDLTPVHPSQWFAQPWRPKAEPPPPPPKVLSPYKAKKGESGDLAVAEGRHKPRRQSYSRNYNPKPRHYSTQNHHSGGGKNGKGGYDKSDSSQGRKGYSSYSSYDKADKDSYADSDHQQYRHKDGGKHGGSHSGGGKTGGGSHSGGYSSNSGSGGGRGHYGGYGGEYGDNGNSYTSSDEY